MAQLNLFNGGLSTRLAPHLIAVNEAVVVENIDIESGELKPLKASTNLSISVSKNIYNFNDTWVSFGGDTDFVEYKENLYYSNGVGIPQKSRDGITWSNLGIAGPYAKPVVSSNLFTYSIIPEVIDEAASTITGTLVTTGGDLQSDEYYDYIILLYNTKATLPTIKSFIMPISTTDTTSVSLALSAYNNTSKWVVYRAYSGVYRKVAEVTSPTLTYTDAVYNISANPELPTLQEDIGAYYIEYTISGKRYIKKYVASIDSSKDLFSVGFRPIYPMRIFNAYGNLVDTDSYISGFRAYNFDTRVSDPDTTITYLPDGIYQYCYTYYNSLDGTESKPSPYSSEIEVNSESINISIVASTDPQVDKIRLYRLGGNLTTMSLVEELDNATTTYVDELGDTNIAGDVLASDSYGQAPAELKYLTSHNAMFFGAVGDKLRFTEIAYVDAWSAYNFIDFDTTITGLGATQNGLLVFTRYATYIVTGTSPETLSKYLLNNFHGCVSHKTIKYANGTLIWLSATSICTSTGGQLQDISIGKLGKLSLTSPIAEVNNSIYYLASNTGILACDFRYGLVFYNISEVVDGLYSYNNTLYFSQGGTLHSMFTSSTNMLLKYKSPKFADGGLTVIKNYKNIYVSSAGDMDITIKISDNTVFNGKLEEGFNDIKGLQSYRTGYYLQIEVQGTGSISEIEYKVEGRQNGR